MDLEIGVKIIAEQIYFYCLNASLSGRIGALLSSHMMQEAGYLQVVLEGRSSHFMKPD